MNRKGSESLKNLSVATQPGTCNFRMGRVLCSKGLPNLAQRKVWLMTGTLELTSKLPLFTRRPWAIPDSLFEQWEWPLALQYELDLLEGLRLRSSLRAAAMSMWPSPNKSSTKRLRWTSLGGYTPCVLPHTVAGRGKLRLPVPWEAWTWNCPGPCSVCFFLFLTFIGVLLL